MASKKLKKFLKKAGMAAAGALALGALRNRSAAENRIKGMIENDSFADARKLMTSNPAMRGNIYTDAIMRKQPLGRNNMMTAKDMANDPMFMNAETLMNDTRMFKKGGRVVKTGEKVAKRKKKIGIQIKGFGKARRG